MTKQITGAVRRGMRLPRLVWVALAVALMSAGCMEAGAIDEADGVGSGDVVEQSEDAPEEARIDKGGAANTCFNWRASGWGPLGGANSVTADCRNIAGQMVTTTAWLPGCMGNNRGNLQWGWQYFDRSCRNCGLHTEFRPPRYRFVCECNRGDGHFQPTNLPVSDFLTNRNGQLTCD